MPAPHRLREFPMHATTVHWQSRVNPHPHAAYRRLTVLGEQVLLPQIGQRDRRPTRVPERFNDTSSGLMPFNPSKPSGPMALPDKSMLFARPRSIKERAPAPPIPACCNAKRSTFSTPVSARAASSPTCCSPNDKVCRVQRCGGRQIHRFVAAIGP